MTRSVGRLEQQKLRRIDSSHKPHYWYVQSAGWSLPYVRQRHRSMSVVGVSGLFSPNRSHRRGPATRSTGPTCGIDVDVVTALRTTFRLYSYRIHTSKQRNSTVVNGAAVRAVELRYTW